MLNESEKQRVFEQVQMRVARGETVKAACKNAGLAWPAYYSMRKKQPKQAVETFPTYSDEPDNELPRLRKLCQAQTALLASVGLKVEVV